MTGGSRFRRDGVYSAFPPAPFLRQAPAPRARMPSFTAALAAMLGTASARLAFWQ